MQEGYYAGGDNREREEGSGGREGENSSKKDFYTGSHGKDGKAEKGPWRPAPGSA